MKAGVLFSKGDIRYADWPDPEVKAGQVRIKVMACGICGSDVPRVHGDEAHFFPIVLGHEFSGVIDEIGEGVEDLAVGDRVTVAPLVPCMKCEQCLTGAYSQCRHYSVIGSREPGGFAEYVALKLARFLSRQRSRCTAFSAAASMAAQGQLSSAAATSAFSQCNGYGFWARWRSVCLTLPTSVWHLHSGWEQIRPITRWRRNLKIRSARFWKRAVLIMSLRRLVSR